MKKDIRQTPEYANYLSQTGWIVENSDNTFIYIKKIPLLGSVIKIQRPETLNIEFIESIAKKHKARRIIIEPTTEQQVKQLSEYHYKISKSPFLPTKTLVVNLQQKKDVIVNSFKRDAQSAIKKTEMLKVIATTPSQFHTFWKQYSKSRFLLLSLNELQALQKAFAENCIFLVTENFSAGAIFLKADQTVYYWKAFTSPKGRKEFAQYLLVWEGISLAKKFNAQYFDFEGIYDERFPLKNWKGFTHFKKSFNGTIVEYPGAYVKNKLF